MRHREVLGTVGVLAALLIGGCGGDGGGGGLTQAQLDAQTKKICQESSRRSDALAQPGDLSDPVQAATFLTGVVEIADAQLEQARALKPADDLKAAYDAFLAEAKSTRDFFQGVLDKAKAKDASGLTELQQEIAQGTHQKALTAAARKAGLSGCADNSDSAGSDHKISVSYEPPRDNTENLAREILQVGGTQGVAEGFTKSFKLPADITINVVRGNVSPFYDPQKKTITWSYGFVDQIAAILRRAKVVKTEEDLGRQLASITSFITVHEMGHAFVDLFEIPITGREEDAVDGMATVFLTDAVDGGAEYAFYAARFFSLLQDVQGSPDVQQFADEHSLSIQRSYDIVCAIAGSSEDNFKRIAGFEILPQARLQRCPAEYRQKSKAWKTLLRPHIRT